jgi:TolB protein
MFGAVFLIAVLAGSACTFERPDEAPRSDGSQPPSEANPLGVAPEDVDIAYTCIPDFERSAGDICVAAADGEEEFRLTDGPEDEIDPSWSPDGRRIVYRVNTEGGSDLYILDLTTGERRNLTGEELSGNLSPAWAPQGDRIAYAAFRPGDVTTGIYVIDADGGEPTRLTPDDVWGEYPAWSPDGSQIVFSRNMTGFSSADFDVWVMNADGTGMKALTTRPGSDGEPAWSPDGSTIAFDRERVPGGCESGRLCAYDIWVMAADGTNPRQLTRGGKQEVSMFPDWSPEGERLLFFYQDDARPMSSRGVYTIQPDGSDPNRLGFGGGDWPDWKP